MKKIIALGLAGAIAGALAVGSLATASAAVTTSNHAAWCEQSYRSYNPNTDSFIGNDGYAHRCISPYSDGATVTFSFAAPAPFLSPGPRQAPNSASGHSYNVFPDENSPDYQLNQNNNN